MEDIMHTQTTRQAAKELGITTYLSGKSCDYGHNGLRYTATSRCVECARVHANKAYASGYRSPNEKISHIKSYEKWRKNNPKGYWASASIQRIKKRAQEISVPFDLTREWLFDNTPELCPVFGTKFTFFGNQNVWECSPTLDRLSPQKGYTIDNVIVISMKANVIKSAYGSPDIFKVATWLAEKGY
jgi:hypothetical protein